MIKSSPDFSINSNQSSPSTSKEKQYYNLYSDDEVWKERTFKLKQRIALQNNIIAKLRSEVSLWKSRAESLRNRSIFKDRYIQLPEANNHHELERRMLPGQKQQVNGRSFLVEETNEKVAAQGSVITTPRAKPMKNNRDAKKQKSSVVVEETANEDGNGESVVTESSRGLSKLCSQSRNSKSTAVIHFSEKQDHLSKRFEAGGFRKKLTKTKIESSGDNRKCEASQNKENAQLWSARPCKPMRLSKQYSSKKLRNSRYKCSKDHDMRTVNGLPNVYYGSITCYQCGAKHLELKPWFNNCAICKYCVCIECMPRQQSENFSSFDLSSRWGYDQKSVLAVERYRTWVHPVINGVCIYYQDRGKKYEFRTCKEGHGLLMLLVESTVELLNMNSSFLEDWPEDPVVAIGQGEKIYHMKPNLRTKGFTWSQEEYSHHGFQR